jgi:hypothetical protein
VRLASVVQHHLIKAEARYLVDETQLNDSPSGMAGNWNNRNEYDVTHASGRSDQPALSIAQVNQFAEALYNL